MKFYLILPCIFLCIFNVLFCQKYDYNWVLGSDYYDKDSIINLSFNNNLQIKVVKSNMNFSFSNTTMSDSSGNLLYYSNGCRIFNRNHQLMKNGDKINFGTLRDDLCQNRPGIGEIGYRGAQDMISIQDPIRDSVFHMIHIQYDYYSSIDGRIGNLNLLSSLINKNGDNGLGNVIRKNNVILSDTFYSDRIIAVKHINNKDWWLILPQGRKEYQPPIKDSTNTYFKILYTFDTFYVTKQNIGDSLPDFNSNTAITNDGNKYLRNIEDKGLYVFDFDRNTGLLANQKLIKVPRTFKRSLIYVTSSPNSRFAYCIMYDTIFQYDLDAPDIQASEVLVAKYDGFIDDGLKTYFNQPQLGPDCRLYISSYDTRRYYHYIKYPDRKGLACEVIQHGLYFGDSIYNSYTIPYYPNYRQHLAYPCDSNLVMTSSFTPSPIWEQTLVYPNPASDYITVKGQFRFPHGQFVLYNVIGKQVLTHDLRSGEQEYTIPVRSLPVGMYFYHIQDDSGVYGSSGKVEIVR
jgi:Secretion system C-terminal sorting domain